MINCSVKKARSKRSIVVNYNFTNKKSMKGNKMKKEYLIEPCSGKK